MRHSLMGMGMILVAAATSLTGCSSKACTLVGCSDEFTASVRSADGHFPSGMHRVDVTADGVDLSCMFAFPLQMSGGGTFQPQCDSGLGVSVWPATICTDVTTNGSVSHQCDPIPDQFVETITLTGTPAQVHVSQSVDGAAILDAAAAPSYQNVEPNGPGCGPVCRQASASWTLQ